MFENVRCVAFDINGTLIDGIYRRWEWVFEEGLGLRRQADGPPLRWYDVQAGRLSFEDAVSLSYVVRNRETLRDEAFRVYMADLKPRAGYAELLGGLKERYEMVICSDTSGVTKVIARTFDLEKYFSGSFYSIDVGWLKSDREFWTIFLSSYPMRAPNEFVMIGDNPRCDVHWPKVFGMGTIQIATTEMLSRSSLEVLDEYDMPDLYVGSMREIAGYLLK